MYIVTINLVDKQVSEKNCNLAGEEGKEHINLLFLSFEVN